jgi:hypothetical protein
MDEKLPKTPNYTQAGTIADPSLGGLRDHIKKIMIPMLIKIFQLKLELSQSISLPSRLQRMDKDSPDTTLSEIKKLDEDLKLLILWSQSCRNQIGKALSLPDEEQKGSMNPTASHASHNPGVSKSFSDAVASQSSRYRIEDPKHTASGEPADMQPATSKTSWLKKMFHRPKY